MAVIEEKEEADGSRALTKAVEAGVGESKEVIAKY